MTTEIDIDAALLDVAMENMAFELPEILAALQGGNDKKAVLLADWLKENLVAQFQTNDTRAEAISNIGLWIVMNAGEHTAKLRDILGLPQDTNSDNAEGDIRESFISQATAEAEATTDTRKRDELIGRAIKHLARINKPLITERWRKELARLGVTADTFKQLWKAALTMADDADPVWSLVNRAAESSDREAALRELFETLSKLSGFEIVKYQGDIQDRFGLSAKMFEKLITETRRGSQSKAEIIEGRLCFQRDPLCNFAAHITHQLTVDDGSNMPTVRYTVTAKLAEGKPLPEVEIDAEEFEAVAKWVPRNWGADAIMFIPPSQSYQVSRAIKELSRVNGMKRETIHTYTGWATVEGKRAYLTAGGAISADGHDPNVRVNLGHNRLAFYKLPAPPVDPAQLKQAIKWSLGFLSLAPRRVTVPLWAAMYGAPLMPMFSLNAVLWPYGPTQSGKSTLTMLALAHFGEQFIKGRDYQAPKDWMSTITDLEGAMFATKDIPLVIDDFAPQFTGIGESRDMHKKAHNVVRSVGNRSSRGRANADLSERAQRPPRGMVIGTAELPLTGQSIVGRMIYVPFERGDVPFSSSEPGLLDWAQAAAGPGQGMYALAMAGYIQWLAANWDQVLTEGKADHERANQYARTVFPSTQSRLMDYYAALYTYSLVPLRYFGHVGAESPDLLHELSESIIPAALVEVLSSQSKRVAGQSPVIRLFEALGDLMLNRKAHLNPRDLDAPAPPRDSTLIGWYGIEDNGKKEIYLRLTACIGLVKDYLTRAGESFDVSTDSLQREIWQAGLITRRSSDHYAISVWIREEQKTVRCLAIDASKLPDMGVGDFWPGGLESGEK